MRFIATGLVHPERAAVDIPLQTWNNENGKVSVSCVKSQLFVVLEDTRVDGYRSAQVTAEHIAQLFVSSVGFLLGCSYKVEITQIIDEENNSYVCSVQRPELVFDVEHHVRDNLFVELTILMRDDLYLRFAIQDYTHAITDHIGGSVLCYRAIESLKKSLNGGAEKNTGWPVLHKALDTTESDINEIVLRFSKGLRHGNWAPFVSMSHEERSKMLEFTKQLITKYIIYSQKKSTNPD